MKLVFGAIGGLILGVGSTLPHNAQAQTYLESYTPNNDRCFDVTYRQQVDRVNTRGVRIHGPSYQPVPHFASKVGGRIVQQYNAPVFLETRTTVVPEHYSLRRVSC
jgi:hypothetical protein